MCTTLGSSRDTSRSSTPGAVEEGPEVPAYQGPNAGIAPGSTPNGFAPNPQIPAPESPTNTPSNNETGVNGADPIPNAKQNGGGNAGSGGNAQAGSGSTPMPVAFAFHGAGRTNVDMRDVDSRTNGSVLEDNYVMAYMKSQGNGWDIGADYTRFEAALEQLLAQRCIDTSAIFALGHSSGAQFVGAPPHPRDSRFERQSASG